MRRMLKLIGCAFVLGVAASPASAEGEPDGGGLKVSGGAALVSDYRFRGISQTNRRPAVQGSLTLQSGSGLYGSVWASSIDDYVANGADAEIDLTAGIRRSFGSTSLDAGVLYYYYPGSGGVNTDFVEPFVALSHQLGPVTGKALVAYAPKQNALTIGNGREDNLYLAGDLSLAMPKSAISLTGHFGRSFGPSYLTIGDNYSDWSLGATAGWKGLTLGVSYVDTDGSFITPRGRNAARGGLVSSVAAAF